LTLSGITYRTILPFHCTAIILSASNRPAINPHPCMFMEPVPVPGNCQTPHAHRLRLHPNTRNRPAPEFQRRVVGFCTRKSNPGYLSGTYQIMACSAVSLIPAFVFSNSCFVALSVPERNGRRKPVNVSRWTSRVIPP